jgi:hypothetical protein
VRTDTKEVAMGSYVLLYSGGKMPQGEEEQAQVMGAWTDWFSALGSAITDPGNPFTPQAKRIRADGSIEDTGAEASGYSVVEADSLDAAADMAKGCPVLAGGASISVYETFAVM